MRIARFHVVFTLAAIVGVALSSLVPMASYAGPGADRCAGGSYVSMVRLDGTGFASQKECIDYTNTVGPPIHGTPNLTFTFEEPSMRLINAHDYSPGTKLERFAGMYHITVFGQGLLPASDVTVTYVWPDGETSQVLGGIVAADGTFHVLFGFTDCDGGLGDITSWIMSGTPVDGSLVSVTVAPPC